MKFSDVPDVPSVKVNKELKWRYINRFYNLLSAWRAGLITWQQFDEELEKAFEELTKSLKNPKSF